MSDAQLDTVAFAERLLALLEEGSFTATYKFAVLLGLMDLCLEGTTKNGEPPRAVTTVQLSVKIVELYWRQVSTYGTLERVLEQSAGSSRNLASPPNAKIPRLIAGFRELHGKELTLHEARTRVPAAFSELLREVEWTLAQMPLPRLQRFGSTEDRFIYEIAWDEEIRRGTWSRSRDFDNRIRFVGESSKHLVRLSGLLRPLIQQCWARKVADLNQLEIEKLEQFLFGPSRTNLTRVAEPLLELNEGRCFYCADRIDGTVHVDHFIPWSRHPDDGIDNLVPSHPPCNMAKKNFLAGHDHLQQWTRRTRAMSDELEGIASRAVWPRDAIKTQGAVRAAYFLNVSRGQRLWVAGSTFEAANSSDIERALAI